MSLHLSTSIRKHIFGWQVVTMSLSYENVNAQIQNKELDVKNLEAHKQVHLLEKQCNTLDSNILEKQLQDTKMKAHSLKWDKIKFQLKITMEEEKTAQTKRDLKNFVKAHNNYKSLMFETTSKEKNEIMEKKGKQRILMLGKENYEIQHKLQAATECRDALNLKICHMETNHNILQNRNAATLKRLRKKLHEVECKRRDIKEKIQAHKSNDKN